MDEHDLQRAIHLYREVNARFLYYHGRMWQGAQFFLSAYTAPFSAAAYLFFHGGWYDLLSIFLAMIALVMSVYGKRVLILERMYAAYELVVRKKLESVLGWKIDLPKLVTLYRWRPLQLRVEGADFTAAAIPATPIGSMLVHLSADEVSKEIKRKLADRDGGYGVLHRMFSIAFYSALGAVLIFSVGASRNHHLLQNVANPLPPIGRALMRVGEWLSGNGLHDTSDQDNRGEQSNHNREEGNHRTPVPPTRQKENVAVQAPVAMVVTPTTSP